MSSFGVLLNIRKPDQGLVQVVEAVGILLGIRNTQDDYLCDGHMYQGLAPESIYPPTLRALAEESPSEVFKRLEQIDLASIDNETAHRVFAKTLTASFARAGNNLNSPGLAPPWTSSTSTVSSFAHGGGDSSGETSGRAGVDQEAKKSIATITPRPALAAPSSCESDDASETASDNEVDGEVDEIIHGLKLAVVNMVRHLMDDDARLPLRNRTMAVLVDGSRMSMLALELASSAWKFGKFAVVHISGEKSSQDDAVVSDVPSARDLRWEGPPAVPGRHDQNEPGFQDESAKRSRVRKEYGRWDPHFLHEQLRETCLKKLGIPEESLELIFRAISPTSTGSVKEITDALEAVLVELGVEVVYMGCYGRRGPRVTHFGRVAEWVLHCTLCQVVFAKKFSPSMVSTPFLARPKRYLVAVTADINKAAYMLDKLLPLVAPRDFVELIHVVDEKKMGGIIDGGITNVEQVHNDLMSLVSNKGGLRHRVRVERTGHLPEAPTQTVVQRIVKAAQDEDTFCVDKAADFLAILHDDTSGSYKTVATGCLKEARCGIVVIH